jgi:hypothetical protein
MRNGNEQACDMKNAPFDEKRGVLWYLLIKRG